MTYSMTYIKKTKLFYEPDIWTVSPVCACSWCARSGDPESWTKIDLKWPITIQFQTTSDIRLKKLYPAHPYYQFYFSWYLRLDPLQIPCWLCKEIRALVIAISKYYNHALLARNEIGGENSYSNRWFRSKWLQREIYTPN